MAVIRLSSRTAASAVGCILLFAGCAFARQPATTSSYHDLAELVRAAVQNELRTTSGGAHFLFRGVKTTPKGSTTKLYVETKDSTAGLIIAYNGQPLTAAQRHDEEARVERFIDHPEELQKKREQERENSDRSLRITRALPDAFLFEYAGEVPSSEGIGKPGSTLIKLNFRPNPRYQPPSRVEEVLAGMQGYILIDPTRNHIACIDGTLFKEVAFGWGILGHLDPGGRFLVKQQEVGDNLWEISSMSLSFTGKILLFKNLNINSTEIFSGFKQVPPNLTFAQGFELLKNEESAPVAADKSCCQQPPAEAMSEKR